MGADSPPDPLLGPGMGPRAPQAHGARMTRAAGGKFTLFFCVIRLPAPHHTTISNNVQRGVLGRLAFTVHLALLMTCRA